MADNGVITVYGASDDLIEVEGAISEEFNSSYYMAGDGEGDLIAFSNGVVLRVRYSAAGVWRITAVAGASKVTVRQAPENDEDNYSDRATISAEDVTWVVHGMGMVWAK